MSAIAALGGGYRPVAYLPSAARTRVEPQSHLRLTRRGRIVVTTLASIPLVIAAIAFALNGGGASASQHGSSVAQTYVTVDAGQSLWQLAKSIAPHSDPRDVISDILSLNGLDSGEVFPGQQLAIPAQYAG
jgi:LysM domain